MYEHISTLKAPTDRMLYLWFEPWAEGLGVPAGGTVELRGVSPVEGTLELEVCEARTAVYGWPGSTVQVVMDGQVVHSFDKAVPLTDATLSTKEWTRMLFGPAPVPDPDTQLTPQKKPWWCFWK